ncbi:MAG: SDR family oxidoreductase [Bacteroidetes bacterium]|nr:SDR family oxidoreductase [Bacteroidota bacterium]
MGNNLLKGKRGIIFGALNENSIAWQVALKCKEEGAEFVLTNAPVAARVGQTETLATQLNAPLIYADVTKMEDLENLVSQSMEKLGGQLDFVLHSVGMSLNVRKKIPYPELNYEYMHQTLDISAMSLHRLLQTLWAKDAMAEWGSVVALTYIAAQRVFPDYSEMADAKSLLESITRSFGYHFGKRSKVRINTISQSPTKTTAGSGVAGFDAFFNYADTMSPLGNANSETCANYCVSLFSDYTRMVTMQNLFHDGGFSFTGVASEFMEQLSDSALGKSS